MDGSEAAGVDEGLGIVLWGATEAGGVDDEEGGGLAGASAIALPQAATRKPAITAGTRLDVAPAV